MVRTLALAALVTGILGVTAASAAASPAWSLRAMWGPTNLPPGGSGLIVLHLRNVGDADSTGTFTVKDTLPEGVTWIPHKPGDFAYFADNIGVDGAPWNCSHSVAAGVDTVSCTNNQTVRRREYKEGTGHVDSYAERLVLRVHVDAGASGFGTNTATVSGGGATALDGSPCGGVNPPCASDVDEIALDPAPAGFGIVPGSFDAGVFDELEPHGAPSEQAGAHPFELRVGFNFDMEIKSQPNPRPDVPGLVSDPLLIKPEDNVKTVDVILPPGLTGNPEAVPKCTDVQFLNPGQPFLLGSGCPPDTQVGYIDLDPLDNDGTPFGRSGFFSRVPVYNMVPPRGTPADFGFVVGPYRGHIYAAVDPAHDYAIKATTPYVSSFLAVRRVAFTMWGVPGDPAHDAFRACTLEEPTCEPSGFGTKSQAFSFRPLLSGPMSCGDAGPFRISVESWQHPGQFTPQIDSLHTLQVDGCDDQRIRFEPDISMQPGNRDAGGPTGLDVHLEVPQREETVSNPTDLYSDNGAVRAIPTPPMKKAVVTFPEGMTISTSAAQGLGNCSAAQIGIGTNDPVRCPDNSRYGSLTIHTPILPKDAPMQGDIYIAKQNENPFHNFLAMYFVIHDESRGLLVKLPGKIELDPRTGQIKTTFDDLPQFPVSDLQLTLKGGVRAALVNPSTCGTKTIKATFYSWADPDAPHTVSSNYEVTRKADGSPCVNSLGERPFKPELSAGTLNPNAGSYSPFVFRLQRTDDDQEFSQLATTLPRGLLANISEVSECPEAGIRQAEDPNRSGGAEALFPSCPASSLLGTTDVGSGVGQVLTYIPGKAYLAGPYRGAPLSMVVVTPILAGPYDLGVIAVRSAIQVNGERAQATIQTDPFPQIYEGIPVRLRDIRVKTDRPDTTLNPTNCNPTAVSAHVTGTGGNLESTVDDTAVDLLERFQAANCAALPFKPKLSFRLKGGTKRGDFPAFSALLRARPGDANIARSTVVLPRSEFIEQGHIRTVCTRVQYAADQCPPGSVYGTAKAKSPLFAETLEGLVYLRSNGGERLLPDLVVSLNGKIDVTLAGFIDSVKGKVRNAFDVIPDAPVTYFKLSMNGGKRGLLVNHLNLCEVTSRADVEFVAQNGKSFRSRPAMGTSCKKAKRHNAKKRKRGASR